MARVTICGGCRDRSGNGGAGAALADRMAGLAEVRLADCLMACGRPLALAVDGPGKGTYLFAGVDPGTAPADLAAFVALFDAVPSGEITDARPCGALRLRLMARLPA